MNAPPPSRAGRDDRPAAVLAIVLTVFSVRASWREARPRSASAEETPVAERLADVVASLPPERRISFVDLGGETDGRRRARIELRLALAPRVLVDEQPSVAVFVTWTNDPATLAARAAARGYVIDRTLSDGYVRLRRAPR